MVSTRQGQPVNKSSVYKSECIVSDSSFFHAAWLLFASAPHLSPERGGIIRRRMISEPAASWEVGRGSEKDRWGQSVDCIPKPWSSGLLSDLTALIIWDVRGRWNMGPALRARWMWQGAALCKRPDFVFPCIAKDRIRQRWLKISFEMYTLEALFLKSFVNSDFPN